MSNSSRSGSSIRSLLSRRGVGQVVSVTIALIVMVIVFGLLNPSFWGANNMTNLLRQVVPILIIGIGQSYVLITAGIDLSIGSVAGMSCMMSATLMSTAHMNPWLATILTLLACCVIGLINGLLIAKAKLPAVVETARSIDRHHGSIRLAQKAHGMLVVVGADDFRMI